jgi:hypothetical protein
MKKILSLVAMLMLTMAASAQITWNVKGGIGFSACYGSTEGLKAHMVGKAGVGIEYPLSANFSLMPSVEVAIKGCELDKDKYLWYTEDGKYHNGGTMEFVYLQIPILGAYRFNLNDSWNITAKAGPYFAYGVDGKFKVDNEEVNLYKDTNAKRFDVGVDVGVDFEYHRFVFGAEYEIGFSNMSSGDNTIKNMAFYLTVGYKF